MLNDLKNRGLKNRNPVVEPIWEPIPCLGVEILAFIGFISLFFYVLLLAP